MGAASGPSKQLMRMSCQMARSCLMIYATGERSLRWDVAVIANDKKLRAYVKLADLSAGI